MNRSLGSLWGHALKQFVAGAAGVSQTGTRERERERERDRERQREIIDKQSR